jgi:hypothetical protein
MDVVFFLVIMELRMNNMFCFKLTKLTTDTQKMLVTVYENEGILTSSGLWWTW